MAAGRYHNSQIAKPFQNFQVQAHAGSPWLAAAAHSRQKNLRAFAARRQRMRALTAAYSSFQHPIDRRPADAERLGAGRTGPDPANELAIEINPSNVRLWLLRAHGKRRQALRAFRRG
jgi:hypothetical protein